MRFSIVAIKDGPFVVVDGRDHRRRVASSTDARAAEMIAALMNGNLDAAVAIRDAALEGGCDAARTTAAA